MLEKPTEIVIYIENGGGMAGQGERRTTYFDLTNSRVYRVDEVVKASKITEELLGTLKSYGEGKPFSLPAARPTQEMLISAKMTPRCPCFDTFNKRMYYATENHLVMLCDEEWMQRPADDYIAEFKHWLCRIAYTI